MMKVAEGLVLKAHESDVEHTVVIGSIGQGASRAEEYAVLRLSDEEVSRIKPKQD